MKRPALFLDRDGTINIDHGYVHQQKNFSFIDGIFEIVKAANEAGLLVVVVTNQAGIGRGYYSEKQFNIITDWMRGQFVAHGCHIDAVYFSPFHPNYGIGKYRKESNCRKPAPGMILKAAKELSINLKKSLLIGDSLKDLQAAHAAGVDKVFLLSRENEQNKQIGSFTVIESLFEVLGYIQNA